MFQHLHFQLTSSSVQQSAYRPFHCFTVTAARSVNNIRVRAIGNGQVSLYTCVTIDLSAAFDTVSLNIAPVNLIKSLLSSQHGSQLVPVLLE